MITCGLLERNRTLNEVVSQYLPIDAYEMENGQRRKKTPHFILPQKRTEVMKEKIHIYDTFENG